jgi:hypothetical protein
MKQLIPFSIFTLFLLAGCTTTDVYPGEVEGRTYINQNVKACEVLEYECKEGFEPFSDETGCGCVPAADMEPEDSDSKDDSGSADVNDADADFAEEDVSEEGDGDEESATPEAESEDEAVDDEENEETVTEESEDEAGSEEGSEETAESEEGETPIDPVLDLEIETVPIEPLPPAIDESDILLETEPEPIELPDDIVDPIEPEPIPLPVDLQM